MSETIMKNSSKDYKELVESLGSLFEMQNEDNDRLLPKLMSGEIAVEGIRPERPSSCQPNGNALGINER